MQYGFVAIFTFEFKSWIYTCSYIYRDYPLFITPVAAAGNSLVTRKQDVIVVFIKVVTLIYSVALMLAVLLHASPAEPGLRLVLPLDLRQVS